MQRPRPASFALLACCLCLAVSAPAQESLLPDELGEWQRGASVRVSDTELERLVGPEAPLLREYGSQAAARAPYRRGTATFTVTVHRMLDRSSAYGAFTLLRPGGAALDVGEAGARAGGRLLFFQGNYFVTATEEAPPAALRALAESLHALNPSQPSLPTLPLYLPREDFVAGSDRYLLGPLALARAAPLGPGDWAGFAYGAEVEAARYRQGSSQATLLLISYPTPQIASARLKDFGRLFHLNGEGDPARPAAYARRMGTLVALVAGAASPEPATQLLDRVQYERSLSWSQPSELETEEEMVRGILSLFIGAGLFVLLALVVGVVFGFTRVFLPRLLPGRRERQADEGEIILLDLKDRS